MGLCLRRATVWAEIPDITVETRNEGDTTLTVYHTPAGDVASRTRAHLSRISDTSTVEIEGMIKGIEDYEPVIFMLENTTFHATLVYDNIVRDIGTMLFRDSALDHESSICCGREYFG
jgi:hypothetical protein